MRKKFNKLETFPHMLCSHYTSITSPKCILFCLTYLNENLNLSVRTGDLQSYQNMSAILPRMTKTQKISTHSPFSIEVLLKEFIIRNAHLLSHTYMYTWCPGEIANKLWNGNKQSILEIFLLSSKADKFVNKLFSYLIHQNQIDSLLISSVSSTRKRF